ncbi:MAG TPA: tol-pal system-associated acyl-CoA thioesterase [Alphaproteobacteria bacterium]
MPEAGVPPAHVFPVRVYYEDTDAAGVVYYANYLKFAERARSEFLRARGIENRALQQGAGIAFAVRRLSIEYLAPAFLDDLLHVHSRITGVHGASIDTEQDVLKDGREIARLTLTLACVAKNGRPARLPAVVRRAFGADSFGQEQER